jgi:uncharacterized membrane protein
MTALSRVSLALFFLIAGVAHWATPSPYLAIIPPYVPWPAAVVAVSGAAEILGGLGVCFRATRRAAGWWLIILLIAVFPANIQAVSTGMVLPGYVVPEWILWGRLPLQLLLITWIWRVCLSRTSERSKRVLQSERGWKAAHLRPQ